MERAVELKVRECREVVIQGLEKTIQHKMVYMFLKDHKKEAQVKQFSVNSKVGTIKVEFETHEQARMFYDETNFVEKILIRPFNVYFNLTLSENEMKKYYLEGITEENQRKLFEASRKIGICKIYTNYGAGPRGKLKSTAVLSFIRNKNIPETDFKALTESLKAIGITIQDYVYEKGLKCSINLTNFYDANYFLDESQIRIQAQSKANELLKDMGVSPVSYLTIVVKKKESTEQAQQKVLVMAIIEYGDIEETMNEFEKMREFMINRDARVVLYFHNEENNSYFSLFTPGLKKPADSSIKQFENQLLQDFRIISKAVIQVTVNHVKYNDTYIGRVYLRSEQAGKEFIVDYSSKRKEIFKYYQDGVITFNINVDAATLRKIKQSEKRAKETEEKIKKANQSSKRQARKPANAFPINAANIPIGLGPRLVLPNISMTAQGIPSMIPFSVTPKGLPVPYPGPLAFKAPGMAEGMNLSSIESAEAQRKRIESIMKDKDKFMSANHQAAKRMLSSSLRYLIEETGISSGESGQLMNRIMTEDELSKVMRYFEHASELKARINEIK